VPYLVLLPLAMCCRDVNEQTPTESRSKSHTILLFVYGMAFGSCVLIHTLSTLTWASHANFSGAAMISMAKAGWEDPFVRFLMVDHGSVILSAVLMLLMDGGFGSLLQVLLLAPFLSLGGAITLFYAKPHKLWLMSLDRPVEKDKED